MSITLDRRAYLVLLKSMPAPDSRRYLIFRQSLKITHIGYLQNLKRHLESNGCGQEEITTIQKDIQAYWKNKTLP